ncbi:MAG TPA: helix-turn-helix domain-containing protein [Ktedonobacteraceae bacterium]|nr:helix-turn-helix domain-containing protein [Ktedonobacteraceae bacterium]
MNTPELQQLKIQWLAAKETGDIQAQLGLLRDHPGEQAALTDFIAAYYATGGDEAVAQDMPLLDLTTRACQSVLERVFEEQTVFATLGELRKSRNMSKVDVAKGLRLTVDVWNKFESGAIELVSLSQRHLERLAQFFQVSIDQFGSLLDNSQPAVTLNRRQTRSAASSERQGPEKQSFAEAIARSTMSRADRQFWLDE